MPGGFDPTGKVSAALDALTRDMDGALALGLDMTEVVRGRLESAIRAAVKHVTKAPVLDEKTVLTAHANLATALVPLVGGQASHPVLLPLVQPEPRVCAGCPKCYKLRCIRALKKCDRELAVHRAARGQSDPGAVAIAALAGRIAAELARA